MNHFEIIQRFFSRMRCTFCSHHLEPDGIELIRQEEDVYVVNVECLRCTRPMGVALVGIECSSEAEDAEEELTLLDPELSPEEFDRLAQFSPVDYDDVIAAHRFFSTLDADWRKHLPPEMQQYQIPCESEFEAS